MQIRDVRDNLVQSVNKSPAAATAKAKESAHAAAPQEPKDVVILSDQAKKANAAPPPDPRKDKADMLMGQVTAPTPDGWPRDNPKSTALKQEYHDTYTNADQSRFFALDIARSGLGSHTLPDGRVAQVTDSGNGVTTVKIQDSKGSSSYREIQYKNGDGTYLQDKQVSRNFLGIESTKSLSRDGNTITTSQESRWLGFSWGKQATKYQLENLDNSDIPSQIQGNNVYKTMVKSIYNGTTDTNSQPSKIDNLLGMGGVYEQTWKPDHYELKGLTLVKVAAGYSSNFYPPGQ